MREVNKYILLFFIIFINCSGEQIKNKKIKSHNKVSIEFKYDIGGEDDKYQFGEIAKVRVDSKGKIYIFDKQIKKISIYSKEERIGLIGEVGRGPGEFIDLQDFAISEGDTLIALDQSLLRISLFRLNPTNFIKSFNVKQVNNVTDLSSKPWQVFALNNQQKALLTYRIPISPGTGSIKRYKTLKLINFYGQFYPGFQLKIPDDEYYIEDYGNSIRVMDLPFKRKSIVKIGSEDKIYLGWTDSLYIEAYSLNGSKQVIIDYEIHKREVTNKHIGLKLSKYPLAIKKEFRNAPIRDTWPAFENFVLSDKNTLWVTTIPANKKNKRVLIFDKKGKVIAELKIPLNLFIQCVKNSMIYSIEKNLTSGKEKVVVYQI